MPQPKRFVSLCDIHSPSMISNIPRDMGSSTGRHVMGDRILSSDRQRRPVALFINCVPSRSVAPSGTFSRVASSMLPQVNISSPSSGVWAWAGCAISSANAKTQINATMPKTVLYAVISLITWFSFQDSLILVPFPRNRSETRRVGDGTRRSRHDSNTPKMGKRPLQA